MESIAITGCASQPAAHVDSASAARFEGLVQSCSVARHEVYVQPAAPDASVSVSPALQALGGLNNIAQHAFGAFEERHFKQRQMEAPGDEKDTFGEVQGMSERFFLIQTELLQISLMGSVVASVKDGVKTLFQQQG